MKQFIIFILLAAFSVTLFARDTEFKYYVSCNYEKEFEKQNRSVYYVTFCKKTLFFDKAGRQNIKGYHLMESAKYAFSKLLEKEARIFIDLEYATCMVYDSYSECSEDRKEWINDYKEFSHEVQQDDSNFSYKVKKLPPLVDGNYGIIIHE